MEETRINLTTGKQELDRIVSPGDFFGEPDGIVELKLINDYVMKQKGLDKVDLELANKMFLNKDRFGMIMMYSPECTHCKGMKDDYKKLSGLLQDRMFMGAVNCLDLFHKNDLLANYLNIESVPVLRLYNGSKFYDYTGGGSMKEVLMWAAKNCKACREIPQVAAYIDRIPAKDAATGGASSSKDKKRSGSKGKSKKGSKAKKGSSKK